jgi:hypothetical protein
VSHLKNAVAFKKKVIAKDNITNEKKTLTYVEDYKGKPILQIWEVDEENHNISNFPVLSFGTSKVKLILKHIEELKDFVK